MLSENCSFYLSQANDGNEMDIFLGVAADGFPIYGPFVGALGRNATREDLDICGGRDFNDGLGYRYIMTNEFPYGPGCLMGNMYGQSESDELINCGQYSI